MFAIVVIYCRQTLQGILFDFTDVKIRHCPEKRLLDRKTVLILCTYVLVMCLYVPIKWLLFWKQIIADTYFITLKYQVCLKSGSHGASFYFSLILFRRVKKRLNQNYLWQFIVDYNMDITINCDEEHEQRLLFAVNSYRNNSWQPYIC